MTLTVNRRGAGRIFGATTALALLMGTSAMAVDLTIMLNENDNQSAAIARLIEDYKSVAPDVNISLNVVGYDVIRDQLKGQLEAGVGPDIGLITDLGGLNPFYVDLTPYVDVAEWEANYGAVLPWYRAGAPDGIYGFHSELTVTGPFINVTLFEEAGVEIPPAGATWDDWAEAVRQVKDATGIYAGMVMDRSGHRFAGPAMSYGAQYFDDEGHLITDQGYRDFAERMVAWHADGTMPPDVWPAVSGSSYANGNEMFTAGDVAMHMAGSWNVGNVFRTVGDAFEWRVVPVPCGPAGCGVMPGGSGFVAFNVGPNAEEAAKFVAWLGDTDRARDWYTSTLAIPAHSGLQAEGLDYTTAGASEEVSAALQTFALGAARAAADTPQAFQLQGNKNAFVMFNATAQYISGVMTGEFTMDEAIARIDAELLEKAR
ncbi:MAG: carbohydrate ABC transporter substrate-binding protein [Rhodobacterales bacterium]|nr:carbohydrate ABC transporter substrate-binding protein [Rhodobacterales bacterium]